MARARFNAEVIGALRERVIAHNESGALEKTRIGELKKVYARHWRGPDPAATALAAVDRHLGQLRKSGTFDESQHQRDESGRFTAKARFADVRSRGEDRALREENAGYRASQTAVIPETRYSLYGPPAALVAGGLLGAAAGIAPGAARAAGQGGARLVGGFLAGKLGMPLGSAAGAAGGGLRAMVRRLRGQPANPGGISAASEAGADLGFRWTNTAVTRGTDLLHGAVLYPAASMARRHAAEEAALTGADRWKARIRNIGTRAALGGLMPGAAYAAIGGKTMEIAGPYLDAAFPRRVEKLAKAAPPAEFAEELAKASATAAALTNLGGRALSGLRGVLRAAPKPALTPIQRQTRAAIRVIDSGRTPRQIAGSLPDPFTGRRLGAAGRTALAVGGAAAGAAVAGGAGYGAARVYYRDEDGKFTSRDRAVMTGSAAAVGAAAGALAGLALGRGANKAFARGIAEKLRAGEDTILNNAKQGAEAKLAERIKNIRADITRTVDEKVATWKTRQMAVITGFTDPVVYAKARLDEAHDAAVGKFLRSAGVDPDLRVKDPAAFEARLTPAQKASVERFGKMRDDALAEYSASVKAVDDRANAASARLSAAKRAVTSNEKKLSELTTKLDADTALETSLEGQVKNGVRPETAGRLYDQARALYGEKLPELGPDAVDRGALEQALAVHRAAIQPRIDEQAKLKAAIDQAKAALPAAEAEVSTVKELRGAVLTAKHPDAPRIRNPFSTGKTEASKYFPPVRTKEKVEAAEVGLRQRLTDAATLDALPAPIRADIEDSRAALAALEERIAEVQARRQAFRADAPGRAQAAFAAERAGTYGPVRPPKPVLRDTSLDNELFALKAGKAELQARLEGVMHDPLAHWQAVAGASARQRAAQLWGGVRRHFAAGGDDPLASGLARANTQVIRAIAPLWDEVVADMRTAGTTVGNLLGGSVGEHLSRAGARVKGWAGQADDAVRGRLNSQGERVGGITEWWTDPAKRALAAKGLSSTLGVATLLGLADKAADGQIDLHFRPLREKGLWGALNDARSRISPFHHTEFSLNAKNHVVVVGATYWEPTSADGKQKRQVFARGQVVFGDGTPPVDIEQGAPVEQVLAEIRKRREQAGKAAGQKASANLDGISQADADRIKEAVKGLDRNQAAQLSLNDGSADGFALRGSNDYAQSAGTWMAALRQRQVKARQAQNLGDDRNLEGRLFFQRLDDIVGSENTVLLAPAQVRDLALGDGKGNGLLGVGVRQTFLNRRGGTLEQVEEGFRGLAAAMPAAIDDRQRLNAKRLLLGINAAQPEDKQLGAGDMERVFAALRDRTGGQGGGQQGQGPFRQAAAPKPPPAGGSDDEDLEIRNDAEGRATAVERWLDALGGPQRPGRRMIAENLADQMEQQLRGQGFRTPHERWSAIIDAMMAYGADGRPVKNASAPLGDLRKGTAAGNLLGAATGAVGERAARPDSRSYFEPVRLGGTAGSALASTAAYNLAEQFMPAPWRAAGLVRRLAWRLGATAAGGLAGGKAGEALGAQAYAKGKAPGAWTPPARPLAEEGARIAGSWGGEIAGSALPGGAAKRILLGTIGSLAGEEAAGAAARHGPAAVRRVKQLRQQG